MGEIALSRGMVAVVDDADVEWLSQWRWYALRTAPGRFYAARNRPAGEPRGRRHILMHREICGVRPGLETDHINGDRLDNRRTNLRIATRAENGRNLGMMKNNQSGFKGVSWNPRLSRWRAYISPGGRQVYLGVYRDPVDAARAYDEAARSLFGAFARLNFPPAAASDFSVAG